MKRHVVTSLALALVGCVVGAASERPMHFPGERWEQVRPEQEGIDGKKL